MERETIFSEFLRAHEQRVSDGKLFQSVFKEFFRRNITEEACVGQVQAITESMKEANGAVRQLIDRIARSEQAPELGEIVRALDRIQMLEKERLQLVVTRNVARKTQIYDLRDLYEEDAAHVAEMKRSAQQEGRLIDSIDELITELRYMCLDA